MCFCSLANLVEGQNMYGEETVLATLIVTLTLRIQICTSLMEGTVPSLPTINCDAHPKIMSKWETRSMNLPVKRGWVASSSSEPS